ncbi:uncharacterized protein J4E88_007665 [Alternaria novae-zelandiae]|uniref:uncharacterized protein n=1 Tax=Alternaria novae-zelandiae TaxID=430562 RepID=UPI0020C4A31B|nr:uncharacterized protein J4E88_007665 [Alternaria novae-zelandiae]KAI4675631.1 hypothetical protein J4E88_007665 [Alternaria novae-zelandiae]
MSHTASKATFLSLPIELRLEIVAYALEQSDAGLTKLHESNEGQTCSTIDERYKASINLAIRLVCRQFNAEFRRLAIHSTLFVLARNSTRVAGQQVEELLQDVKKLRIHCDHETIGKWYEYPLNRQCMHLDELQFVMPLDDSANRTALVGLLRRLRNVKQVKLLFPNHRVAKEPYGYIRLLGELLKEDHFQRYDARNAPNFESTRWEWSFDKESGWAVFVAREPMALMPEEHYLLLMKPKIEYIMDYMAS